MDTSALTCDQALQQLSALLGNMKSEAVEEFKAKGVTLLLGSGGKTSQPAKKKNDKHAKKLNLMIGTIKVSSNQDIPSGCVVVLLCASRLPLPV